MCSGEFRQIPPVIPGAGQLEVVMASMKSSSL